MKRAAVFSLLVALAALPAAAKKVEIIAPTARPSIEPAEPAIDLSHALPGKVLANLPPSVQQLKTLNSALQKGAPELSAARQKSESLAAEAAALRRKLIETAAHIEDLERQAATDAVEIDRLTAEDKRLNAGFMRDRVSVTRLIAVLERLQHDMPPALAMRPDDALAAARGSMLIGASLPPLYGRAAALSRRIDALRRTRLALTERRAAARATADKLARARIDLDGLLGQKEREAQGAVNDYGTLKTQLEAVAAQAADFRTLLGRIAVLRRAGGNPAEQSVVTVTAENTGGEGGLARNSLLIPVVGTAVTGGQTPGLTFATRRDAQVIAPADGKVLFAGPYHKSGQVLILEITTGYDLVLAGLGRVTVRLNDEVLAGEPVGNMPGSNIPADSGTDNRLYFELRHGGHGLNPAPWLSVELRKASRT